ncbi:type II toxin-antitoxin system RelE/ParE family toxin [bacterium]|nr:type II toxin-antitoxin system RelE/ParE family toxin [bacterium]
MDFQVRWLKPALSDLEDQVRYQEEHYGAEVARQHLDRIHQAVEILQAMPASGRFCRELPGYHEKILRPDYRIVYRIDLAQGQIKICAVIASKQDFLPAWKQQKRI